MCCDKLRPGPVFPFLAANSFSVTAGRCEFFLLGQIGGSLETLRKEGYSGVLFTVLVFSRASSSGHPTPSIWGLKALEN